jgi:hypothetical protein
VKPESRFHNNAEHFGGSSDSLGMRGRQGSRFGPAADVGPSSDLCADHKNVPVDPAAGLVRFAGAGMTGVNPQPVTS